MSQRSVLRKKRTCMWCGHVTPPPSEWCHECGATSHVVAGREVIPCLSDAAHAALEQRRAAYFAKTGPGGVEGKIWRGNPKQHSQYPASMPMCESCERFPVAPSPFNRRDAGYHATQHVGLCRMCQQKAKWSEVRGAIDDPEVRAKYLKRPRDNPSLMLITGNPAPTVESAKRAWCEFHQKDEYTGTTRDLGPIHGAPPYAMALGKLHAIDLGHGQQTMTPEPWVAYNPADDSLWIVADDWMSVGPAAGAKVKSLTYDPMRSSNKTPAYYKHEFGQPNPALCPVGSPRKTKAILLEGGVYTVRDWVYD